MMRVDQGKLRAYLDGELSAAEREFVEKLLADSPEAQASLAQLDQTRDEVNQTLGLLLPTAEAASPAGWALKRLQARLNPDGQVGPALNKKSSPKQATAVWESPSLLAEIKANFKNFRYHWRQVMTRGFVLATIAGLMIVVTILALALWPDMAQRVAEPVQSVVPPETVNLPPTEEDIPTTIVVVALQPISRGAEFVPGSIGRHKWPARNLPSGYIANEAEAIGKVARTDIVQGQVIVQGMLVDPSRSDTPELPPAAIPLSAVFNYEIELIGYQLQQKTIDPKEGIELILYWRSLQAVAKDYTVFIHLADANRLILAQEDSPPVQGQSPTSRWQPDQVIEDRHHIPMPQNFPVGKYDLIVGLYNSATGERLSVQSENHLVQDNSILLTRVQMGEADSTTASTSGAILFQKDSGIYVINADGTNLTRLASGNNPTWSPDGQRIAFLATYNSKPEIYVMNADGANPTRLTYSSGVFLQPVWSPDGQRLAFVSGQNDVTDIYVINADGTNQVKLTDSSASNIDPRWSPDGQRLAFASYDGNQHNIYVMNANGTNLTKLTDSSAMSWRPIWSPDGQHIAFLARQGEIDNVYLMNADGANPTPLTDNPSSAKITSELVWSPDGQHLAFALEIDGQTSLYTVNADGTNQTRLTDNLNVGFDFAWSPDSQRLAFISYTENQAGLFLINADGTNLTRLADNAVGPFVEWSPHHSS